MTIKLNTVHVPFRGKTYRVVLHNSEVAYLDVVFRRAGRKAWRGLSLRGRTARELLAHLKERSPGYWGNIEMSKNHLEVV